MLFNCYQVVIVDCANRMICCGSISGYVSPFRTSLLLIDNLRNEVFNLFPPSSVEIALLFTCLFGNRIYSFAKIWYGDRICVAGGTGDPVGAEKTVVTQPNGTGLELIP